jgi:formylglycine-generating enzyme required for sulfatase activity
MPSATSTPKNTVEPTSVPIVTETRQADGMMMIYIPARKFTMGSDEGEADEGPIHDVYLDDYWMDQTEITNGMYALCVESGSCETPMKMGSYTRASYYDNKLFADYPVIYVDWDMAKAYCEWAGARLPTEAEWEKAARSEDARIYPWGNDWDVLKLRRLNFADKNNPEMTSDINVDDGYRDTAPVGSYPGGKSPYEIYDLAGNVWEWVADWYDPLYYRDSPLNNPPGPTSPTQEITMRVLRGGAWVAANQNVFHTSNRNGLNPSNFSESIGFRCAR